MKALNVKTLAIYALVAAVYAALTIFIAPISYGAIQFRLSEVLVLLCFYNRGFAVPLILGCALANAFSPLGLIDVGVGTLATALAVIPMSKAPNLFVASLLPVVSNAILVGAEIYFIFEAPFVLSALSVAFGEFVVVSVAGAALFKFALEKSSLIARLKV